MALGFNPVFRKDKQIINLFHQLLMFICLWLCLAIYVWEDGCPPGPHNLISNLCCVMRLRCAHSDQQFSFPGCSLRYWKRRVKISRRSSTWLTVPGDPSGMRRRRKGNENAATRQSIPLSIYVSWQLNLACFSFLLFFLSFPHSSLLLWFSGSRTDLKRALPLQAFLKQTVTHQLTAALASQANLEAAVPWAWRESQGEEEEPLRWPRQEPQW